MVLMMGFIITSKWGTFSLFQKSPFWLMRRHFSEVMSFYQCCQIGIFLGDSSAGQRLVHAAKEATTALKLEAPHITSLEAALQIKINASKQFRIFAVESSMMAFFTVRCQMGSTLRNECLIIAWKLRITVFVLCANSRLLHFPLLNVCILLMLINVNVQIHYQIGIYLRKYKYHTGYLVKKGKRVLSPFCFYDPPSYWIIMDVERGGINPNYRRFVFILANLTLRLLRLQPRV